jgi:hypothetical protein
VRINIEVEDDYIRAIMDRYGVHTMTREEALAMRGAQGRSSSDVPPLADRTHVHPVGVAV